MKYGGKRWEVRSGKVDTPTSSLSLPNN